MVIIQAFCKRWWIDYPFIPTSTWWQNVRLWILSNTLTAWKLEHHIRRSCLTIPWPLAQLATSQMVHYIPNVQYNSIYTYVWVLSVLGQIILIKLILGSQIGYKPSNFVLLINYKLRVYKFNTWNYLCPWSHYSTHYLAQIILSSPSTNPAIP